MVDFRGGKNRGDCGVLFDWVKGDIVLGHRSDRGVRDGRSDIVTYFWDCNHILCKCAIYQIVDSTRIIWWCIYFDYGKFTRGRVFSKADVVGNNKFAILKIFKMISFSFISPPS